MTRRMPVHLQQAVLELAGKDCPCAELRDCLHALQADLEEGRTVFEEGTAFTIQGLEHEVCFHITPPKIWRRGNFD